MIDVTPGILFAVYFLIFREANIAWISAVIGDGRQECNCHILDKSANVLP